MRILIDASAAYLYRSTGIGAYAGEIEAALKEIPSDHDFYLFTGADIFSLKENIPIKASTCQDFWERAAANHNKKIENFDIYHNLHNGIGLCRGAKKTVITVHDMIPQILPQYSGKPYKEIFMKETPMAIHAADSVITVSQNSKNDIISLTKTAPEKVTVIYEAMKHHCKPLPAIMTANYLKSHYNIASPFFLYIGGFNKRKNVDGLLKAYAGAYRQFPGICPLVIVGKEGSRRKSLESLAEELSIRPYIRFVGYVPDGDLPFFYNQCKALIYPSFYEGFGLPPLEAAACGAAVITSSTSCLPEIMGEGALYANPRDSKALGNHMISLARDEKFRQIMASRALQRSKKFTYQRTAAQTIALYEKICR